MLILKYCFIWNINMLYWFMITLLRAYCRIKERRSDSLHYEDQKSECYQLNKANKHINDEILFLISK